MPFKDVQADLDSETLKTMRAAFDQACGLLKIAPEDPRTSGVAIAIANAVKAGERGLEKLRECGLAAGHR